MKAIPAALNAHLAGAGTELALCWRITRRDGQVRGFTSHDADLTVAGLVYSARAGFLPTAIDTKEGLNVDNIDVQGLSMTADFDEAQLIAGLWDGATVEIMQINWRTPTLGAVLLRKGTLGEVEFVAQDVRGTATGTYKAELRGMMQSLQQTVGQVISTLCRASLGDAACGINLPALTVTATVTTAPSLAARSIGAAALVQAAGFFNYGQITFATGANAGYTMEVQDYTSATLTLFQPMPFVVAVGDVFTVTPGCDRHFGTCIKRFNNAPNFRGEPHLPGQDKIMQPGR